MITLKEHNVKPYGELCTMLAKEQKCAYVAATGTGKSYVAGKYVEDRNLVDKTLVLVPSAEIKRSWKKLLPGVSVVTYSWLCSNKESATGRVIIICDEMHHLGADVWGKVYREVIEDFKGQIIGLTATPIRFLDHGRNMAEEYFEGHMVEGLDLPAAISAGILPSFEYVSALYNLPKLLKKRTGHRQNEYTDNLFRQLDFYNSKYSFKNILKKHLSDGNHKVAVFVNQIANIDEVRSLCEEVFPNAGHRVLHTNMKRSVVKKEMAAFSESSGMEFVYTVNMLNEGVHIDGVDCVIMFRRTESPALYLQQIGRAMSPENAHKRVKIFDFVANHKNIKSVKGEGDSIIRWIMDGIGDESRQIVISDYAIDEMRLLERIEKVLSGFWTDEEDALLIEKYDCGKGLDELAELLPHRTRVAIAARACALGINKKPGYRERGLYDAVAELYLTEDGPQKLREMFPEVKPKVFNSIAIKLGLKRKELSKWTDEEVELLRQMESEGLKVCEQARRLNRNLGVVCKKRVDLGFDTRKKHLWTDSDDQILLENTDLTAREVRDKYFPDISVDAVRSRRQKIGASYDQTYSEEKLEALKSLYAEGGAAKVLENEMFQGMDKHTIIAAARLHGVKVKNNRSIPWTDEEKELVLEYINTPEEEREDRQEWAKKIPRHSYKAVVTKCNEMKKKSK